MQRGMNKAVIITVKTRLQEMIHKYNTPEQAKFYIEHMGADFSDYLTEHENYTRAVEQVKTAAEKYARVQLADRAFLPDMLFGRDDIVIAVGRDGLVANIMKYLDGQSLIGINPDTKRWDGVLLPFEPGQTEAVLKKVTAKNHSTKTVTLAKAQTLDGQVLYAVNDLFIGQSSHISARYDLTVNSRTENQSSSGIIISTGLGSTGWYKSVITQAQQLSKLFGTAQPVFSPMPWDEKKLLYIVREPFPGKFTQAELVCGALTENDTLTVTSKMPENGVIFSDGMENDRLSFDAGARVTVSIAEKTGQLVV